MIDEDRVSLAAVFEMKLRFQGSRRMQKIRIYVDNSHIDTLYVSHRYINERVRQFKHNRIIHTHATHNTHTHTHTHEILSRLISTTLPNT